MYLQSSFTCSQKAVQQQENCKSILELPSPPPTADERNPANQIKQNKLKQNHNLIYYLGLYVILV